MTYKKMTDSDIQKFMVKYSVELNSLWQYVNSLPVNSKFQLGQIKSNACIAHLSAREMRRLGEVFALQVAHSNTHVRYLGKASNNARMYMA